jgi:hypothetical protein
VFYGAWSPPPGSAPPLPAATATATGTSTDPAAGSVAAAAGDVAAAVTSPGEASSSSSSGGGDGGGGEGEGVLVNGEDAEVRSLMHMLAFVDSVWLFVWFGNVETMFVVCCLLLLNCLLLFVVFACLQAVALAWAAYQKQVPLTRLICAIMSCRVARLCFIFCYLSVCFVVYSMRSGMRPMARVKEPIPIHLNSIDVQHPTWVPLHCS